MADVDAFVRSCRETSRQLRRLPADLRRELGARVQEEVAAPEAARVASTFTGPWAAPLAAATKARKVGDPTIIVGGARKVVSGGASARQLVYGAQFGGGKRVGSVTRRTRRGSTTFRRNNTAQFQGKGRQTILPTINRDAGRILDAFAGIVDDVLGGIRG